MHKKAPLTDRDLFEIETVAVDATPGPWEPQMVLDFQSGEATRAVVRMSTPDADCEVIVEHPDLAEADQRYIAAMHPDAVLRLVKELRRLRRVEERMGTMLTLMSHLNEFLERRNLTAQAQRFVEVRAQLENIHPDIVAPGETSETPFEASGPVN
jgi:hypothetical protein